MLTTLEYLHQIVIPGAYALLPPRMASPPATALLLAIALQETRAEARQQFGDGPAMGFWQFERGGGVRGLLTHRSTQAILTNLCEKTFQYSPTERAIHEALEHNDLLAACCARLLLYTVPAALPTRDEGARAYGQYIAGWRPGRPHPETWPGYYRQAWAMVDSLAQGAPDAPE